MDTSTQSLESLLGVLHSKISADMHANVGCKTTDHDALLQKMDSILVGVCASLDILHAKVDSLCAGMQLMRTELEVTDLQPAIDMPPHTDVTTTPDFVAINVREDRINVREDAVDGPVTVTTLVAPIAHEPESNYTNSTDILNVLWPGLPKHDNDELCVPRIRQEAELVQEVD